MSLKGFDRGSMQIQRGKEKRRIGGFYRDFRQRDGSLHVSGAGPRLRRSEQFKDGRDKFALLATVMNRNPEALITEFIHGQRNNMFCSWSFLFCYVVVMQSQGLGLRLPQPV